MRGDDPIKIMRAAGHERFDTTNAYIVEAEGVREGLGQEAFPGLPEELFRQEFRQSVRQVRGNFVELRGIEPRTS